MKSLIASRLALGLAPGLLAMSALALAPAQAAAEPARQTLEIDEKQTLAFPRQIGRVEVEREDVIVVSAPTSRSLRITGVGGGQTTLSVYSSDGDLMEQTLVSVAGGSGARFQGAGTPMPGEKVVAVDVQFAAVSSSTLKALGFSFSKLSGDLQGAVVSPSSLNSASFGPSGLTLDTTVPIQSAFNLFLSAPNRGFGAVLSALSTNGLSQLLAQPTLLVRSGEKASFLAGGEFPVPVPQSTSGSGNTISIDYKEFGVKLTVSAFVLSKDNIVLQLSPEVSELDYANGVQLQGYVVPGIRRRSAETTVELGSGQSFVIAGLNYSNSSVSKDKLPLLGDIPILGAFFKRQQNSKERQELIIVATPRLVDPLRPEDVPPLPGAGKDIVPTFGQMVVGKDKPDQAPFGVVRR